MFYIPTEIYTAAPYVVAVGVGCALPVLGMLQYRVAERVAPDLRLVAALAVVGAGALLSVMLTHRTLNEALLATEVRATYADYEEGFAASRWLTLLLLFAAFVEALRGWMRSRSGKAADPARPILVSMLVFFLGTIAIQGLASEVPGFNYKTLYVPLLLVAVCYLRLPDLARAMDAAKWIVFVLCAGSLAAAVVRPDFVLHRPEPGLLPGIDWRLFGLTPHANTLGPVALLAILLELHEPSRRLIVRYGRLAAALSVFVLAQSKTAWGTALAIGLAVYAPLALVGRSGDRSRADFSRAAWTLLLLLALSIAAVVYVVAASDSDVTRTGIDIDTFSGRTRIWEITLHAWHDNLLFGYGPEIWGLRRRIEFNMFHVGQAHNQVVQTLGEAGLFGLGLLLAFLATLTVVAMRTFRASRGIVLAILVLTLGRCFSEAPMRADGILSWSTFLLVILVAQACHAARTSALGERAADPGHDRHAALGRPVASAPQRRRWA